MTTDHAQAQMHPDIAHLQAFLTATSMRFDALDLIDMRARIHGVFVARNSCIT